MLWVDPLGLDTNTGSKLNPLRTVHRAVTLATPGTAVIVKPGSYVENVKVPSLTGGTPEAPCQLVLLNGANIKAANLRDSVIKGLSIHDWNFFGLGGPGWHLQYGANGIQVSMSGTNMVTGVISKNIRIQGFRIREVGNDGVKISQADFVQVLDNIISCTGENGIDFVAVNDSVIAHNQCTLILNADESQCINAKCGSTRILIERNRVHTSSFVGISVGGYSSLDVFRPDFSGYEAKDVIARNNWVSDIGGCPCVVTGAVNSTIEGNRLDGNPHVAATRYAVMVDDGQFDTLDPGFVRSVGNYTANLGPLMWNKTRWGATQPAFIDSQPSTIPFTPATGPRLFEPWPGFQATLDAA